MPKKTHQHTIHLTTALENVARERSKNYRSLNEYIAACIEAEMTANCGSCRKAKLADNVTETFRLFDVRLPN